MLEALAPRLVSLKAIGSYELRLGLLLTAADVAPTLLPQLAISSTRSRCSSATMSGTPFCGSSSRIRTRESARRLPLCRRLAERRKGHEQERRLAVWSKSHHGKPLSVQADFGETDVSNLKRQWTPSRTYAPLSV